VPVRDGGWGSWGFFSKKRQIFVRQISIHRGKFSRDFAKSGKPPPSPRAISLVRLRRGQAICRLAQLARFLIRNGAGRGERARISGRFAELTLRGCRLSPNRRSLLFGLACSVLCMALSLLSRGTGSYGVHSDLLTDRSLGRQIFEDFRALRAQANFHSNFGKSPAAPIPLSRRLYCVGTSHASRESSGAGSGHCTRRSAKKTKSNRTKPGRAAK
jgi:hypothetical protein